jgi:hypothetical protein
MLFEIEAYHVIHFQWWMKFQYIKHPWVKIIPYKFIISNVFLNATNFMLMNDLVKL